MTNGMPAFEPLHRLLNGDQGKVRKALDVFLRVTKTDLELLDAAHADDDWGEIARIMHKTKSACLQIGEQLAATAAMSVEDSVANRVDATAAFAIARRELQEVRDRVERYLTVEERG